MRMISIVNELISQGHQVDFYIRKDGGILIQRIDGRQFSGAKGNAKAREMVGQSLSEARMKQLKYATATRKAQRKLPQMDDAVSKEYERVKKLWNKAFKSKKGMPHPAGYFGKGRIRYSQQVYGTEEALKRIKEAERYATGIAYSKNVAILASFVKNAGIQYQSDELLSLAKEIEDNASAIREEWIEPAYKALYDLNHGVDAKEVARNVRRILRL